ncbi:hypothetical protein [Komagataeibacter oboediens]|uniref:hypothetical protein n=1 Tax=Komagataeibacter oboediens TaxID=65958 RepID=UPI00200E0978|nr:hypothetical protein [Komagataeibacter oboediens]MCK9819055.1 hypothetical protein [Komagataeibacter oboediens]
MVPASGPFGPGAATAVWTTGGEGVVARAVMERSETGTTIATKNIDLRMNRIRQSPVLCLAGYRGLFLMRAYQTGTTGQKSFIGRHYGKSLKGDLLYPHMTITEKNDRAIWSSRSCMFPDRLTGMKRPAFQRDKVTGREGLMRFPATHGGRLPEDIYPINGTVMLSARDLWIRCVKKTLTA